MASGAAAQSSAGTRACWRLDNWLSLANVTGGKFNVVLADGFCN
jgi:hypothetical protein